METTQTNGKPINYNLIIAIFIIVVAIVLLSPLLKSVKDLFKGIGDVAHDSEVGLGLTNSDAKKLVNKNYETGNSPLASTTFDKMQKTVPKGGAPLRKAAANMDAIKKLKSAMGILWDDDNDAIKVFTAFKTKFQVAYLAKMFQEKEGSDFFTWLRKPDHLFAQGFKAATVEAIVKYVNSLPNFKP